MKTQNLAIIFLIIILPLTLILSYYLHLQRDTLKLQNEYNAKLLESTKEAIQAYETNSDTSVLQYYDKNGTTEKSNVLASINTFITSMSNSMGIAGTAKEYMLNYIPAITMTLYDGYYIYSQKEQPMLIKDSNGANVQFSIGLVQENSNDRKTDNRTKR